ncbi:acyltransferase [Agrobacterium sp. 33MFTa1.1]|uniref:acyltransferase family protein n=1 Tax=Agrobacterium TaxID=357 RepID=UPI000552097D|nr:MULTISPECIES: acyltransferase [Agrobacterium]OAI85768.1 exopolysaccharide biosynthesis protein [Rhizobium sp. GHKF11]PTV69127.1 acyltransferase [Agrobacterium pusense]QBJ15086.1 acyltransferase [Agrobacterium sp. 33MFTa1.1]
MIINLQVLRAVAAFMVFFHHFMPVIDRVFPGVRRYEAGASGVDIFFVLSGFIMVVTTHNKDGDPLKFLVNRIVRVVPIYWIMTFIIVFIFLLGARPLGVMELQPSYVWKSLFFIPFERGGFWEPVLSVGWTLNYEMFFYVVFSILMVLGNFYTRILLIIFLLCSFVLSGLLFSFDGYMRYYSSPVMLDFALGAAFGAFFCARKDKPPFLGPRGAWFLIVAGASVILATSSGFELYNNSIVRPLTWGVAGLLLVSGCVFLEQNGYVARHWLLVHLGNASYSIYLVHNLVIQIAMKVVGVTGLSGIVSVLITGVLALLLTIVCGLASYRFIEAPINRAYRKRDGVRRLSLQH